MAIPTKTISFPQAFAIMRGTNYFANEKYRTFPGVAKDSLFSTTGILFSNWKGDGFFRPALTTYVDDTLPSIPANAETRRGYSTETISNISAPVNNEYTITHTAYNIAANNPGQPVAGTVIEISSVTPSTFNGLYEITTVVSGTSTKVVRVDGATNLGSYTSGGIINISTLKKYSLGAANLDYKRIFGSGTAGDWTKVTTDALENLGTITEGLSDTDGSYVRLRSVANTLKSRAALYDVDYVRLYQNTGQPPYLKIGDGKFSLSGKCKVVGLTNEHCTMFGFWRTHSGDFSVTPMPHEYADAAVAFYAGPNDTTWQVVVVRSISNELTYVTDVKFSTAVPINVLNTLEIELDNNGSYAIFKINGNIVYRATNLPVEEKVVTNPSSVLWQSPVFAGIDLRQKNATQTAATYNVDVHIYDLTFNNFNAYQNTGISLMKKLK